MVRHEVSRTFYEFINVRENPIDPVRKEELFITITM
jgi:hypothetical protein